MRLESAESLKVLTEINHAKQILDTLVTCPRFLACINLLNRKPQKTWIREHKLVVVFLFNTPFNIRSACMMQFVIASRTALYCGLSSSRTFPSILKGRSNSIVSLGNTIVT